MPPAPNSPKPYLPYTQTFPAPGPPDPADVSPTVPAGPTAPPPAHYPPAPPPGYMPPPVPVPVPVPPGRARRRGRPGAPRQAPLQVVPVYAPYPVMSRPAAVPPAIARRPSARSGGAAPAVFIYSRAHVRTRGNKWAVASLLCLLLSGLLFPIAFVFSLFGVIFGHMARGAIKRHPDVNNRLMANICLCINYIVLLVSLATLVGIVVLFLALASGTISW